MENNSIDSADSAAASNKENPCQTALKFFKQHKSFMSKDRFWSTEDHTDACFDFKN